jgi:hypothetical protein
MDELATLFSVKLAHTCFDLCGLVAWGSIALHFTLQCNWIFKLTCDIVEVGPMYSFHGLEVVTVTLSLLSNLWQAQITLICALFSAISVYQPS